MVLVYTPYASSISRGALSGLGPFFSFIMFLTVLDYYA